MAAYLFADTNISDPEKYEQYKRQAAPLIERYGGRYLVRGGDHDVLEGDWEPTRLVVLEFPDMTSLKAWYNSQEYAPVKALRMGAASARLIAVEGM
jgi:uncharacterized protein (DUF1330 family)